MRYQRTLKDIRPLDNGAQDNLFGREETYNRETLFWDTLMVVCVFVVYLGILYLLAQWQYKYN